MAAEPLEAEPAEEKSAEVDAPETWSEALTIEQKAAFMKAKVVPTMGPLFQAYDAEAYADFGCQTCHGPDNKMPTDYLPELTFQDGKLTAFAEEPEMAKFMAEVVTPNMAEVFGVPPYNPETHEGFGCSGCHSMSK